VITARKIKKLKAARNDMLRTSLNLSPLSGADKCREAVR
jgi:hypothetical protein